MSIQACGSYNGKFHQGLIGTVLLKLTTFDGVAVNAESISITIQDNTGTTIVTAIPDNPKVGLYAYDWEISTTQPVGQYDAIWTYDYNGQTYTFSQQLIVSADVTESSLYSDTLSYFRAALDYHITCAQNIPIYNEEARPTTDYINYYFTFNKWNQTPRMRIYRNNIIQRTGFNVNFFGGYVTFDSPCLVEDTIRPDYNFAWFSESELNLMLQMAMDTMNTYAPHTSYSFINCPARYIPAVINKAAADAIRQMLLCINFQQPAEIFGGADAAKAAFSNLETLKKNYEETAQKLLDEKKKFPYVGLTKAVAIPEYTLPGGRSRWFRYLFSNGV